MPDGDEPPSANLASESEALSEAVATDPALQSLARALALSEGFAFQLVACDSAYQAKIAIDMAEQQSNALREAKTRSLLMDPYASRSDAALALDPQQLVEQVLDWLLTPQTDELANTIGWLNATQAPAPTRTDEVGLDDDAWRELFRRMNERRNLIIREFNAPLTLVAPVRLIRAFAEEAPDFWSIRSLSVYLAGVPGSVGLRLERSSLEAEVDRIHPDPSADALELSRLTREQEDIAARLEASPSEATHLAALAAVLEKQSAVLERLGRWNESHSAIKKAVGILRTLAERNPQIIRADLAWALNILSFRLNRLGHREAALAASDEAVHHYRALTATDPKALLPNFASSLNNLSNGLSNVGRHDEALNAASEATEIRRQLAKANPEAFLSSLAISLNTLGGALSDVGRRDDALNAASEATEIYRQLAKTNPQAFLPDLALSLNNLGAALSYVGRRDEALNAAIEATEIRRQLFEANPQAFLPDLALSLNNLSNMLSNVGQRDDALNAAAEATQLGRELAKANPEAFLPNLATSLHNLGIMLSNVGQRDDALNAAAEAVTLYSALAQALPAAFTQNLSIAARSLKARLESLGLPREENEAYVKAMKILLEAVKQRAAPE